MAALPASDIPSNDIDNRLAAVARGKAAKDASELFLLAAHAYKIKKFSLAARLFAEGIERNLEATADRQAQPAYNAACSAALAASGEGEADPPLEDTAKAKLRSQALTWLKQELTQWQKHLGNDPKSEQKQTVAQTLAHWQKDSDLASIRDPEKLATLPEAERKDWETLWTEVKALEAKVSAESMPSPPSEALPPAESQSSPTPTEQKTPPNADPPK